MQKGIFSKCLPFYSKKTLRIKQNVWFWHTFQNKSVIYSPQFFFYCWTTAEENCFFWLDFIVFQAFVFLLYNYIHTGRTAGSLCDTKNIKTPKHWEFIWLWCGPPPPCPTSGNDNDWWPVGIKLSSAVHRWQVSGDSLSHSLPRQLITIWERVRG